MNILCITHTEFEPLDVIETWALAGNHSFKMETPYKNGVLADIVAYDFLVIMGVPQSAPSLDKFPYLSLEIDLIQSALSRKKILEICLGAQLIGTALEHNFEPRSRGFSHHSRTNHKKRSPVKRSARQFLSASLAP